MAFASSRWVQAFARIEDVASHGAFRIDHVHFAAFLRPLTDIVLHSTSLSVVSCCVVAAVDFSFRFRNSFIRQAGEQNLLNHGIASNPLRQCLHLLVLASVMGGP